MPRPTYECGCDGPNAPDTVPCLRRQLAAERAAREAAEIKSGSRLNRALRSQKGGEVLAKERDEAQAACAAFAAWIDSLEKSPPDAMCKFLLAGVADPPRTNPGQPLLDELSYLREHHVDCHQAAGNYELLLCRLRGEPTNHGDCAVAARLDDLEAENERLTATLREKQARLRTGRT